jgi:hypothetical protein
VFFLVISTYLHLKGYLGKFDCEEQVITNTGSMRLKVAKWLESIEKQAIWIQVSNMVSS